MESTGNIAWNYLLKGLALSATQLGLVFGPFILLALIMHLVSKKNETLSVKLMGRTVYLCLFGWLGISVHELGHALFALIFGHRINKINFISPHPEEGSMGYVDHSYNPGNIYHQIGNFFIGIGPILLGTFLLYLLSMLLFDVNLFKDQATVWTTGSLSLSSLKTILVDTSQEVLDYLKAIWTAEKSSWGKMMLLGYALYSIGSSISLSRSDLRIAWKGFLIIALIVLVFNLATQWIADFSAETVVTIAQSISAFCAILMLSIAINLVFMGIILLFHALKK